ncbi:MAG: DUF3301 domain-containing protein [Xanthomonadales bacterium]|nr:DUF3301 domain-containing protein [Xanthomonadales bacterium]
MRLNRGVGVESRPYNHQIYAMELLLIIVLVAISASWLTTMRARDRARIAVARLCKQYQLQLLDQSVALAGMKVARSARGGLTLRRQFRFDYSEDGLSRKSGSIWMKGEQPEMITIERSDGDTIEWLSGR